MNIIFEDPKSQKSTFWMEGFHIFGCLFANCENILITLSNDTTVNPALFSSVNTL
jgi:hypothetical protein